MRRAYFISLGGKVTTIASTHIAVVIANPAAFGMERAQIESTYRRFNEPIGWKATRANRSLLRY
jgi:hypothetical protein